MKYINNSLIVPLQELPKIGTTSEYRKGVVYSIQAYENEKYPEYIFYNVYYSERLTPEEIDWFMFGVDSYYFGYAVKITDFAE